MSKWSQLGRGGSNQADRDHDKYIVEASARWAPTSYTSGQIIATKPPRSPLNGGEK